MQLKVQGLLYPVLQALDLNTPSYQQNQNMPILPRTLMVRFWAEYFSSDPALLHSMMTNTHNSPQSAPLLKFVDWSSLLPEPFHRKYNYSAPRVGRVCLSSLSPAAVSLNGPDDTTLLFESRFESGNLLKAVKV